MLIYVGNLVEVQLAGHWQEFGGKLVQFIDATFSQVFDINGKPHRDNFLINLLPSMLDGAELGDEIHMKLWLDVNGPIDPRNCVGRRGPMHVIAVSNVSKAKREIDAKAMAFQEQLRAGLKAAMEGAREHWLKTLKNAPRATETRRSKSASSKARPKQKPATEAPVKRTSKAR